MAGAIAAFEKLGLGLALGDYLGKSLSNTHIHIYIFLFISASNHTRVFPAIGAIFAATDSVCTLQVHFADFCC